MTGSVPTIVLGGSGYVAGELLRLLSGHPLLRVAAVVSESQPGEGVDKVFPHLSGAYPELAFCGADDAASVFEGQPRAAVFSAAPHGASAPLLDRLLTAAEDAGCGARAVDLSADYRFRSAERYRSVYGKEHPVPRRFGEFSCAVPEHAHGAPTAHVAHPGCFTTAAVLAIVPLLKWGLIDSRVSVVAITGSTGAGRTPTATTHHPERRSTVFGYGALAHRHEPEMRALAAAASGVEAEIDFVPQSGPFARGIYATVHARLAAPTSAGELAGAIGAFYAHSPFVRVTTQPPSLQEVVGTNRCRLGVASRGDSVVVFSAIDNLVKGAAGGAIQWMNRMMSVPEESGLQQPGLGWL